MSRANLILSNMGAKAQVEKVYDQKDEMVSHLENVFNGKDNVDDISEKIKGLDEASIQALTDEEVDAIFNINGESLDIPEHYKESLSMEEVAFKRDLLVFTKTAIETISGLDKSIEELDMIMDTYNKEMDEILASNGGSLIKAIRSEIEDKRAVVTDEKIIKNYDTLIEAFDDSFELKRVIDIYSKIKPENTIFDMNTRMNNIYKQYRKVSARLGIGHDLSKFGGLEVKFLEEKYQKYPNLTIFIMMKYASKRNTNSNATKHNDGVFLSQFCTSLYLLFMDQLEEEYKTQLLNSIRTLLDLFI